MEKVTEKYLVKRIEQLEKENESLQKNNAELTETLTKVSNDSQNLRLIKQYFVLEELANGTKVIKVVDSKHQYVGHLSWEDDTDFVRLSIALDLKGE